VSLKIEKQIEFWALLGPLLLIFTLVIASMRPEHHLFFSITALIGLGICWRWKLNGLAIALLLLACALGWQIVVDPVNILWDATFSLAIALSFTVTALSYSEVEISLAKLKEESAKRLEEFVSLNEKIHALENEKETNSTQESVIQGLTDKLDLITAEKTLLEDIAAKGKQEIHSLRLSDSEKEYLLSNHLTTIEHLEQRAALHAEELLSWRVKAKDLLTTCHENEILMKQEIDDTYIKKLQLEQQVYILQEKIRELEESSEEQSCVLEDSVHELHFLKEELSIHKQELLEKDKLVNSDHEIALEKALIATEEELTRLESYYSQDIDKLYGLIDKLMKAPNLPHSNKEKQANTKLSEKKQEQNLANDKKVYEQKKKKGEKESLPPKAQQTKTPQKSKKTKVWANAILSRWSEPHDHSQ